MDDSRRILVVDTAPDARERFASELSGKGHAVTTASSGEEALWQLSRAGYDLVVTSMSLRGISGVEVAQSIHARQPGLPVIIISGDGTPVPEARAALTERTEILQRPVSAEKLAQSVEQALQAVETAPGSSGQIALGDAGPAKGSNPLVSRLKNIGLFLLGPFISLFYLLTFPVVGLGMLIYMAFKAKGQSPEQTKPAKSTAPARSGVVKTVATMLAMVLSGVAFGIFVPLLGTGLVLWFGLQAWGRLGAKAVGPGQS